MVDDWQVIKLPFEIMMQGGPFTLNLTGTESRPTRLF